LVGVPTFAGIEDASEYRCFIALFPAIILSQRFAEAAQRTTEYIISLCKNLREKNLYKISFRVLGGSSGFRGEALPPDRSVF